MRLWPFADAVPAHACLAANVLFLRGKGRTLREQMRERRRPLVSATACSPASYARPVFLPVPHVLPSLPNADAFTSCMRAPSMYGAIGLRPDTPPRLAFPPPFPRGFHAPPVHSVVAVLVIVVGAWYRINCSVPLSCYLPRMSGRRLC